jgi:hypothetical protein
MSESRLQQEADAYARKHSGLGPRDPRYGRHHRAFLAGARAAIELAAQRCCTVDSSDSSHETAESNAKAIRALLEAEAPKEGG